MNRIVTYEEKRILNNGLNNTEPKTPHQDNPLPKSLRFDNRKMLSFCNPMNPLIKRVFFKDIIQFYRSFSQLV